MTNFRRFLRRLAEHNRRPAGADIMTALGDREAPLLLWLVGPATVGVTFLATLVAGGAMLFLFRRWL